MLGDWEFFGEPGYKGDGERSIRMRSDVGFQYLSDECLRLQLPAPTPPPLLVRKAARLLRHPGLEQDCRRVQFSCGWKCSAHDRP